ncbi:MAG: ABC transporter substrate-binding protein [Candidatus Hydrogenedentes bacterium]|nr:ABC transporter substrate-binding protein [Candidatus Hydrogenedentota bacterium]
MNRHSSVAVTVCLLVTIVACNPGGGESGFRPMEPGKVLFWDRQTTETADLLRKMIDEFNTGREGPAVEAQYAGDYSDIFRKVRASIQARAVPDMAVAYQSMTSEYVRAGACLPLDPFMADPAAGLSSEELGDFFPVVLETNRLPQFGGKMYSFPFCKSVLMMYFNKRVLAEAGIQQAPATWDEFLEQCRQIKAKTGKSAYAVSVDASTIDGMVYSRGGDVIDGNTTLFDSPPAMDVFRLLETLAKEELAYQIPPGSADDKVAFSQDRVAFVFRSSSHRTNMTLLMEGNLDRWGIARLPQADPAKPTTVLYGPNICIFDTTPEQSRVAWDFVRFFTSRENTVRWALATGYVPIRKSAADHPEMKKFWDAWEYNRTAFDCLPFARSEPTCAGWQEVRGLIEDAETAVLSQLRSADEAARELKKAADAVLAAG